MSEAEGYNPPLIDRIRRLVAEGKVRVSYHGNEELSNDAISTVEAIEGLADAEVLEQYEDTAGDRACSPYNTIGNVG